MKFLLFLFSIQVSCFLVNACKTGEVRLVNGTTANQGRVEICSNGVWGTVCDDFWSNIDAKVVCRQLGYSTDGATAFSNAYYGSGTGAIILDDVQCSGNECNLLDCSHDANTLDCSHSEDAGVSCPPLDTCTPFNSIPSPTASTIIISSTNSFCEPPSSLPCDCPTTTTPLASVVFTVTTTFTISVTATTTEAGTASAVDSCTASVMSAIILPVLLLIIIISLLISLTLIYYRHGISKILNAFPIFNEPVHDGTRRTSTLEVDNKAIYNISDNEAYNAIDTSRQDPSGSASLPLSSIPENQAPIYSEVNDTPDTEAEGGEEVLYENSSVMTD